MLVCVQPVHFIIVGHYFRCLEIANMCLHKCAAYVMGLASVTRYFLSCCLWSLCMACRQWLAHLRLTDTQRASGIIINVDSSANKSLFSLLPVHPWASLIMSLFLSFPTSKIVVVTTAPLQNWYDEMYYYLKKFEECLIYNKYSINISYCVKDESSTMIKEQKKNLGLMCTLIIFLKWVMWTLFQS